VARGAQLKVFGEPGRLAIVEALLLNILQEIQQQGGIAAARIETLVGNAVEGARKLDTNPESAEILRGNNGLVVKARTPGQLEMLRASEQNDILFAIGPAGTGKTYTAVAIAAKAMRRKEVKKIVLVRPAVEAGESLGFLPGDLKEKIDPYLRPLYDALEDMVPPDKLKVLLEQNIIEIVPLAYMRGRTLNNAFIILDEAQNATVSQLKMFLTRLGNDSRIIVTGDPTQIDLPKKVESGLESCIKLLDGIPGIGLVQLTNQDVVRHKLVRAILRAYEHAEALAKANL
jgi:phosphate starvation-inducible protein PhoH and related proteins